MKMFRCIYCGKMIEHDAMNNHVSYYCTRRRRR